MHDVEFWILLDALHSSPGIVNATKHPETKKEWKGERKEEKKVFKLCDEFFNVLFTTSGYILPKLELPR